MKHTLFILALITATIQTFAQSPRIKLNQITKDSLSGSVLISSPTDSGMVYSRDLFISYGADTVLILNGDTLAATSAIISSVLSDGVTITGDGTTGSELTVDTNTVIATKQDLNLYYLDSNPDGYTSNTGTVTSVGGTGTVNGISLSGTVTSSGNLTLGGTLSNVNLASQVTGTLPIANGGTGSATQNFVDLSTTQTVGGAKTFTSALTQSGGDVNFDSGTFFVDAGADRVGIGTSSPISKLTIEGLTSIIDADTAIGSDNGLYVHQSTDITSGTTGAEFFFSVAGPGSGSSSDGPYFGMRGNSWTRGSEQRGRIFFVGGTPSSPTGRDGEIAFLTGGAENLTIDYNGNVGIGTTSPSYKLDVVGDINASGSVRSAGTPLTSDIRLKKDINSIYNGIEIIKSLNPVSYYWNDLMLDKLSESKSTTKELIKYGLVAQEVEAIMPEFVSEGQDGFKSIDYQAIITLLIASEKEQQSIIESQATEIEQLKTLITELSNRLQILENN